MTKQELCLKVGNKLCQKLWERAWDGFDFGLKARRFEDLKRQVLTRLGEEEMGPLFLQMFGEENKMGGAHLRDHTELPDPKVSCVCVNGKTLDNIKTPKS